MDYGSQWHLQCISYVSRFKSLIDQFGLDFARPGNNFFTDRHRTVARYLSAPVLNKIGKDRKLKQKVVKYQFSSPEQKCILTDSVGYGDPTLWF